ncbi:Transmembrane protein 85 [Termitomyces sp. J132]|nr:Transmembrane protein 85 [Termitomyces sp. J132]
MQAFMLYMSGGGVQIFSMGIVFMLLLTPFKNLVGMNESFAQFAPTNSKNPKALTAVPLQKLVFIACNLLTLGVGLWKCKSMGLLPTGSGDWLAFETRGMVRFKAIFSSTGTYLCLLYFLRSLKYLSIDATVQRHRDGANNCRLSTPHYI